MFYVYSLDAEVMHTENFKAESHFHTTPQQLTLSGDS
jgi:hypothetical protein